MKIVVPFGPGGSGDIVSRIVDKRLLEIGITPPPRDWDIAKCDAFVKRERVLWDRYIKLAKIEPQ